MRRIRVGLLRARRERPRRRRAAEQRDELAPFHSITSSARASSVGGTVEAEHPGGLGVDDQLELRRLHDRQVCGLRALEDAADIGADLAKSIGETWLRSSSARRLRHSHATNMSRGAGGAPPGGAN